MACTRYFALDSTSQSASKGSEKRWKWGWGLNIYGKAMLARAIHVTYWQNWDISIKFTKARIP